MVEVKPAEFVEVKVYNKFYFSYRVLLALVGFIGYMATYMQKIDMGIGIVW